MIKSQRGIESAVRLSSSLQSTAQEDKMSVAFQKPMGKPVRSYYDCFKLLFNENSI